MLQQHQRIHSPAASCGAAPVHKPTQPAATSDTVSSSATTTHHGTIEHPCALPLPSHLTQTVMGMWLCGPSFVPSFVAERCWFQELSASSCSTTTLLMTP